MNCQILFPEKKKNNINLLSAELAQRVVSVNSLHAATVTSMSVRSCDHMN